MALTKSLGDSGGGSAADVADEGSVVQAAASQLNFVGSGVTAASDGSGGATITITAGSAPDVKDEGSVVQAATATLDFVGAGVTAASDGSGGATITIPGGSSPDWVTYHPDTPPGSPTLFGGVAYDHEYVRDNALPSGSTVLGTPATSPSIVDRALRVVSGTSASADVKGIEWACPGSAFTMTAKLRRKIGSGTFGEFGLMLRRNASGALLRR